jgi:hypothetical protein
MEACFWDSVQKALNEIRQTQKWLFEVSGVKRTAINRGINKLTKMIISNPHTDEAVKIAQALNTTVEYLVTGERAVIPGYTPEALKIARAADKLDNIGKEIALEIVEGLETKHPLAGSESADTAV